SPVIPAKAGIQGRRARLSPWIPAFAGMTKGEEVAMVAASAASMPEMPHPREHHRNPRRIGGRDHLGVAERAPWLDHGGGAGLDGGEQAVGEGEEGVGGDDGPFGGALGR